MPIESDGVGQLIVVPLISDKLSVLIDLLLF